MMGDRSSERNKARLEAFTEPFRLREAGQLDEAIAAFHSALEAYPEKVSGWLALGDIWTRKKRYNAAAAAIQRAADLRPTEHLISGALFHSLLDGNRIAEAVAEVRRFLALDPAVAKRDDELLRVYRQWDADREELAALWLARVRD